ncbi:Small acid-soluble spore protein,alpha/beta-type [Moorella glycerini]|uniref:Small, acid-soluble spore protein, alpha/beta type n=1 Tax=Neomoorella stamsii TaxID=1266720 RepID=A0A9X7J495_9FIRM|nr:MULTISPECIES: alpha/beta-type small acid-soluble spore protein [Moorella]PRR72816.1 Small, acid-soluble spore protein, alpha/beta type [Moorella stamsii]CEP66247.1 Small acid-soluble spore protein,alpha/beta-type [Moorella glycerini]CEP68161.1 Small acid-soluble spore protein,alpha/beta-type [Moorella glycerini]
MGHKKDNDRLRTERQLDKLKWETAKELGLDDDLASAGDELTTREAGKIGGNMVRKLVKAGEKALAGEGDRKARLNLQDDL